jgi:hypothetical protein
MGGLPPDNQTPPIVDLAPGETASALLEGTNNPTGTATSCPIYSAILVTPPGETHSVRVGISMRGCTGLEIHPVVPGSTGRVNQ